MSKRKAGPVLARGAFKKKAKIKPETKSSSWVIEWRGWKPEELGTGTVYIAHGGLSTNINYAMKWSTRADAVKWAKDHVRNRPFGDPSWKDLIAFVEVKQ